MSSNIPHVANKPVPGLPYFTPTQEPISGLAVDPQPDGKPIPTLFKPLKIRGTEFQNRIFVRHLSQCHRSLVDVEGSRLLQVAPMCQYSAEDGVATEWHKAHSAWRLIQFI